MSAFADVDLSFSQVRMLMVLASVDTSLPIHQIAAHLGLTVASAGRNVDSLLRALVDRGDDDHDRRVQLVHLNAGGRDPPQPADRRRGIATITLGGTDLAVSRLCLGRNVFGWTLEEPGAFEVPGRVRGGRSRAGALSTNSSTCAG